METDVLPACLSLQVRILGLNMGITGLAVLWSTARDFLIYKPEVWTGEWIPELVAVANFVVVTSVIIGATILLLFVLRMALNWEQTRAEANDAEYAPVFCMGSIALMVIAGQVGYFIDKGFAEFLWCLAVALHVLLIANWGGHIFKFVGAFFNCAGSGASDSDGWEWKYDHTTRQGRFSPAAGYTEQRAPEPPNIAIFYPTYFVPPVGIAIAALTCANAGTCESGAPFFYFAAGAYVVLLPFIFVRAHFVDPPLNDTQENTYIVFADPPALLLNVWITVMGGSLYDPWTHILFAVMCIFLIAVIVRFIWKGTLSKPFLPSQAAWLFSSVMIMKAWVLYLTLFAELEGRDLHWYQSCILWFVVLLITGLAGVIVARYCHSVANGVKFTGGA